MFDNKYPYLDFHELNLDWLLDNVGDINTRLKTVEDEFSKIKVLTREEIQEMIDESGEVLETKIVDEITESYHRYVAQQISIFKVYVDEHDLDTLQKSQNFTNLKSAEDRAYTDTKLVDYTYMINPITGARDDVREVVRDIITYFHSENTLTAAEYDALNLSATAYDSKQISAYDYDYNGKNLLP